jgi:hypothetical protein
MRILLLCCFFASLVVLVCQGSAICEKSYDDVCRSVKANAQPAGSCRWSILTGKTTKLGEYAALLNAVDFQVLAWTREHVASSFTSANAKLGQGIVDGVPKAMLWATNGRNSWQLPPEHPRNNKTVSTLSFKCVSIVQNLMTGAALSRAE